MPDRGRIVVATTHNLPREGDTIVERDYTQEHREIIRLNEGVIKIQLGELYSDSAENPGRGCVPGRSLGTHALRARLLPAAGTQW